MARLGEQQVTVEEVVQVAVEEDISETQLITENTERSNVVVVKEEPVPANVITLSSGVRVQFLKQLTPTTSQRIIVTSFQDANIDVDGRVRDDISSSEQLKLAKRMFDYSKAILSFGLAFKALKLYDGMPKDKSWLSYLKLNPIVKLDNPEIDWDDKIHQEMLYLLYEAFANDEDLQYLSEKLLSQNQ